jgi:hypothetical protein
VLPPFVLSPPPEPRSALPRWDAATVTDARSGGCSGYCVPLGCGVLIAVIMLPFAWLEENIRWELPRCEAREVSHNLHEKEEMIRVLSGPASSYIPKHTHYYETVSGLFRLPLEIRQRIWKYHISHRFVFQLMTISPDYSLTNSFSTYLSRVFVRYSVS